MDLFLEMVTGEVFVDHEGKAGHTVLTRCWWMTSEAKASPQAQPHQTQPQKLWMLLTFSLPY